MVCIFDEVAEPGCGMTAIVEIFFPGGKTPPNVHRRAHEMFFCIAGQGKATCSDVQDWPPTENSVVHSGEFSAGDAMLLPPNTWHVVENTGSEKLITLTVMVPNEGFAELIHGGVPCAIDADDLALLSRNNLFQ